MEKFLEVFPEESMKKSKLPFLEGFLKVFLELKVSLKKLLLKVLEKPLEEFTKKFVEKSLDESLKKFLEESVNPSRNLLRIPSDNPRGIPREISTFFCLDCFRDFFMDCFIVSVDIPTRLDIFSNCFWGVLQEFLEDY